MGEILSNSFHCLKKVSDPATNYTGQLKSKQIYNRPFCLLAHGFIHVDLANFFMSRDQRSDLSIILSSRSAIRLAPSPLSLVWGSTKCNGHHPKV